MCTWFSASWRRFRYDRKCLFSCIYNPQITISPTLLFSVNFNGNRVKNYPKPWTCPLSTVTTYCFVPPTPTPQPPSRAGGRVLRTSSAPGAPLPGPGLLPQQDPLRPPVGHPERGSLRLPAGLPGADLPVPRVRRGPSPHGGLRLPRLGGRPGRRRGDNVDDGDGDGGGERGARHGVLPRGVARQVPAPRLLLQEDLPAARPASGGSSHPRRDLADVFSGPRAGARQRDQPGPGRVPGQLGQQPGPPQPPADGGAWPLRPPPPSTPTPPTPKPGIGCCCCCSWWSQFSARFPRGRRHPRVRTHPPPTHLRQAPHQHLHAPGDGSQRPDHGQGGHRRQGGGRPQRAGGLRAGPELPALAVPRRWGRRRRKRRGGVPAGAQAEAKSEAGPALPFRPRLETAGLQSGAGQVSVGGGGGGGDSSVVRAPDSWPSRGFESLEERRENCLLQGRLSVLTLISVSVPPPCYRSST